MKKRFLAFKKDNPLSEREHYAFCVKCERFRIERDGYRNLIIEDRENTFRRAYCGSCKRLLNRIYRQADVYA